MTWRDFTKSHRYKTQIKPILNIFKFIFWYGFLVLVSWKVFEYLTQYSISANEVKESLPNIISTMGIMNAILITFIFSKLYSEKSEIIARKQRIQELSKKLNALRKISYVLFKKNQFWNKPKLIEEYYKYSKKLSENYKKRLSINQFEIEVAKSNPALIISSELKSLWGIDSFINVANEDYVRYNIFNQTVYKLNDLEDIYNSFKGLIGYEQILMDDFVEIDNFSNNDKDIIKENMVIINEKKNSTFYDKKVILYGINDYLNIFLDEHYVLIKLNSSEARSYFNNLLFVLLVSIFLIIAGMLLLSSSVSEETLIFSNKLIIAIFIASVIDILKNIYFAVRFEFRAHGIRDN